VGRRRQRTYWLLKDQEMPEGLLDPVTAKLEPIFRRLRAEGARLSGAASSQ
jgi:hypothetical protein